MATSPPATFGTEFLTWLRDTTERAWDQVEDWALEDYERHGLIGARWQHGTRWTGGLDDATIEKVEHRYGVTFPPQYRLFLQTLHSTTPWQRCACYADPDNRGEALGEDRFTLHEHPGFYDWLHDETDIREAMGRVEDRSAFAEEVAFHHGGSRWLPGGPSPALIPIFGHRYVVADDEEWVLSIVDEDAIVYGKDLRAYLLAELDDLLGWSARPGPPGPDNQLTHKRQV
ncbi:MAG: SMI1/KNR4 family protein [Nocardioides sp.]|nr:SMI1/KNR4 family protein [Nocardioides sp.]